MSYFFGILFILSLFCLLTSLYIISRVVYVAGLRNSKLKKVYLNSSNDTVKLSDSTITEHNNLIACLLEYGTLQIIATVCNFPCIVGREKKSNIIINDQCASKRHMVFTCQNNCLFVEDLQSANGTWINGHRITSKQEVKNGDIICIGQTIFTLIINLNIYNYVQD